MRLMETRDDVQRMDYGQIEDCSDLLFRAVPQDLGNIIRLSADEDD